MPFRSSWLIVLFFVILIEPFQFLQITFVNFYLYLTCVFIFNVCLLYTAYSWVYFLIHPDNLCLFIDVFSPFTFTIWVFSLRCIHSLFHFPSSSAFLWINQRRLIKLIFLGIPFYLLWWLVSLLLLFYSCECAVALQFIRCIFNLPQPTLYFYCFTSHVPTCFHLIPLSSLCYYWHVFSTYVIKGIVIFVLSLHL